MTFLGMGYLEVLVVLLIAFIVMGPERMVDAARLLGRAVGEVRRMAAELPSLDLDEPALDQEEAPVVRRPAGTDSAQDKGADESPASSGSREADETAEHEETPVAFRPSTQEDVTEEKPEAPS